LAHKIADLTFDEVVLHLIAGDVLKVTGGEEFSLSLPDSRAILAFYNQDRRTYWNPEKDPTIQDGEIDRVLDALDKPPKVAAAAARPAATLQKWRLVKVVAHRFRDLHRHCAATGADPHPFELELAAHASLFRGFNGAGKTSLVSAICWCLTGYGHRSQGLPSILHEPIQVQVRADGGDSGGDAKDKNFPLPVIVPIPTEAELVAVDGGSLRLSQASRQGDAGAASVFYLENVGQSGEGEYVQFTPPGATPIANIPIVQQHWKVLGSIFG